jgi:hypothetical protein
MCEVSVAFFFQALPLARGGLAQSFRIQFVQVQAGLKRLEHLEGFEASQRNGTQELLEVLRALAEENVG